MKQAESDFACATYLQALSDSTMYCHIVAKFQQAVEKSIKSLVAVLAEANIIDLKIKFNHDLEGYMRALHKFSNSHKHRERNRALEDRIQALFSDFHRQEIEALTRFAPKQPAPGARFGRNTEYPFQNADGNWTVPSQEGVFRAEEIERFQRIAIRILDGVQRIITTLDRGVPRSAI